MKEPCSGGRFAIREQPHPTSTGHCCYPGGGQEISRVHEIAPFVPLSASSISSPQRGCRASCFHCHRSHAVSGHWHVVDSNGGEEEDVGQLCPVSLHPQCCHILVRLQPNSGGAEERMPQASLCPDASLQLCLAVCSLQQCPAHGFLASRPLKAPAGISYTAGLSQPCQHRPEAKECDCH